MDLGHTQPTQPATEIDPSPPVTYTAKQGMPWVSLKHFPPTHMSSAGDADGCGDGCGDDFGCCVCVCEAGVKFWWWLSSRVQQFGYIPLDIWLLKPQPTNWIYSYFTHAVSETHCIKTVSVDDWFNVHLMRYTSVKIQTEKHHLSLRLSEQRPGSFVIPHVGHPIHLGKFDFFHQLCIWLKFQIISLYLRVTIVPLSPFLGGYFIHRRDVPMSRLPTKRFTHRSQRLNVPKADDGGGFTAGRGLRLVEVGGDV